MEEVGEFQKIDLGVFSMSIVVLHKIKKRCPEETVCL
jgi:hypothetical protein